MSFVRPTLSELITRARGDIETRLPGADSRLRHSVLDVLARMHGGAVSGLYGYLDYLALQLMPDTADAGHLNRWASIWGIYRKAETSAEATATATGIDGSVIAAGTELQRADGALYLTAAAATIAAGAASVAVAAQDAGVAGDVEAGSTLTFTSPVAGVNATATIASLDAAGADEESDDSLAARLLERIRRPPQGGAAADYVAWALARPGVTRAWAYPLWMGLGTVGLTFVMDGREDPVPTVDDVAAVQAALDELRPVTAELVVFAPTPDPVDYVIEVTPDTLAVRAAIEAELADFHARESEPGGTIWLSRINEAISLAEGEFRHVLTTPAVDVVATAGVIKVVGTVSFV